MLTKIFLSLSILILSGCTTYKGSYSYKQPKSSKKTPSAVLDSAPSDIMKKNGEPVASMRPYTVLGKEYYPTVVAIGDTFSGRASWYGSEFHGKMTSSGETYDMNALSAAHKTLPMNTVVRVTNLDNNLNTVVRINDRGPFVESRIIDLSYAAAKEINLVGKGNANVRLEVLGFEPTGTKTIDYKVMSAGPKQEILTSFAVQIGAFANINGAVETQKKYASFKGYSAIIKDSQYNNDKLYRVWLRGFRSEAEARDFIAQGYFSGQFITRE
ncbi:MAG: septal ring lytic transglycosylase RlpA family protein [Sulfuricurvum sp.]|uniref:septal ring lytic transglycosylase RlpA family protein n=1 Tax=Sulfuricurvum sp. TaxID=2025608 RepID=UPI00262E7C52|nr:septal ring lytic transglycosylase RlpA family protein [Sulfuricurvum sp.]MDD2829512.1 septal ring lytic transglycosylase RlpA family protein [Sulfuricurvum sp.]MDD4949491.1 septal ring lytic transglycosylase RlpA family protein [Sulfuricurvum sp.]